MADLSILPILKKIPLFEDLNEEVHQEIINNITMQFYPENHILFTEGDDGDKMFIIKSGSVRIARGEEELALLSNDAFFGEMALISANPRNATAKVTEDAEVFILRKDDFDTLLANNPDAAEKIKKAFNERYPVSE